MKLTLLVVFLYCIYTVSAALTAQQQQQVLAAHNKARKNVYPAANPALNALTYSDKLAASAQAWASQCILDFSDGYWWRVNGENVAAFAGQTLEALNVSQVVADWAGQNANYYYDVPECEDDMECDNYLQLASSAVTAVGCGAAKCNTPGSGGVFFVCQYDVYALWKGVAPYTAADHVINDPYVGDDADFDNDNSTDSGSSDRTRDVDTYWWNVPDIPEEHRIRMPEAGGFNWKKKGAVSSVKNQGGCGCCWAFASAAAAEGAWKISKGKLYNLSPQQIIDCVHTFPNCPTCKGGCKGGHGQGTVNYAKSHGLTLMKKYPYKGKVGKCNSKAKTVVKLAGNAFYGAGNKVMVDTCRKYGPLQVSISSKCLKKNHGKGVISGGGALDHSVLLVGWDGRNFIIKNQWGKSWGNRGYGKVNGNAGKDCGITSNGHGYDLVN